MSSSSQRFKKYLDGISAKVNELRAICLVRCEKIHVLLSVPLRDISRANLKLRMRAAVLSNRKYELLGETLALLTGTPYIFPRKSHDLTHNELKQWYRDRENESLNEMEKFLIDKGLVSHSDRMSKSAILGMVVEYLKRRQHVAPTTPAFDSPFLIDNLLKNDR